MKMTNEEAVNKLLSAMDIDKDTLKELELKVKFSNGKQLKVEFENKHDDEEDKD